MSLGPESTNSIIITPGISELLLAQDRYQANLPLWYKYLIWRYTMGSGSLTQFLIHGSDTNYVMWTYQFFAFYNYNISEVGKDYLRWKDFFINPRSYAALPEADRKLIANQVIRQYIIDLERIILGAPTNNTPITVYRATNIYNEILPITDASENIKYPQKITFPTDFRIFQKPFNSTTYDSQLDFSPFLGVGTDCCLYKILIPKCSRLLAISPVLHAYPHEREILLPFASTLIIHGVSKELFNYYPADKQRYTIVQQQPLVIGEVYRLRVNSQFPESKEMRVFECEMETPFGGCSAKSNVKELK